MHPVNMTQGHAGYFLANESEKAVCQMGVCRQMCRSGKQVGLKIRFRFNAKLPISVTKAVVEA
jgi:hypothetical protein